MLATLMTVGNSTDGTRAKLPGTLPPPSSRGACATVACAGVAAAAMQSVSKKLAQAFYEPRVRWR